MTIFDLITLAFKLPAALPTLGASATLLICSCFIRSNTCWSFCACCSTNACFRLSSCSLIDGNSLPVPAPLHQIGQADRTKWKSRRTGPFWPAGDSQTRFCNLGSCQNLTPHSHSHCTLSLSQNCPSGHFLRPLCGSGQFVGARYSFYFARKAPTAIAGVVVLVVIFKSPTTRVQVVQVLLVVSAHFVHKFLHVRIIKVRVDIFEVVCVHLTAVRVEVWLRRLVQVCLGLVGPCLKRGMFFHILFQIFELVELGVVVPLLIVVIGRLNQLGLELSWSCSSDSAILVTSLGSVFLTALGLTGAPLLLSVFFVFSAGLGAFLDTVRALPLLACFGFAFWLEARFFASLWNFFGLWLVALEALAPSQKGPGLGAERLGLAFNFLLVLERNFDLRVGLVRHLVVNGVGIHLISRLDSDRCKLNENLKFECLIEAMGTENRTKKSTIGLLQIFAANKYQKRLNCRVFAQLKAVIINNKIRLYLIAKAPYNTLQSEAKCKKAKSIFQVFFYVSKKHLGGLKGNKLFSKNYRKSGLFFSFKKIQSIRYFPSSKYFLN
ncbi:hypothetical protein BpHYR1_001784 [Brachionus plicatilis]|uniref:Uncharacterized protein n=1 Tax=Brachionus plicatilis TaxID=10195 RepID=A0A3M7RLR7_BRAPC|nr:hypothetical protein BpHYR1_001784 [Brachionus plicatilis]